MPDIKNIKFRLKDYLTIQGVQYDAKKKTYRCPNPAHNDNDPSAVFYKHGKHADYPVLWCPICREPWSIIDVAMMLHGFKDIPETMEHIKSVVGIVEITDKPKREEKKPEPEIIPVSHADRRKYYNGDYIKKIAAEKGWGDVVAVWEYTDKNDMVTALDVRFKLEGKKTVITWTYNGKLKHYGVEPQIYNLYECLSTDKPILITEGCKCAEISRQLEGFTPCSWSGGAGKAGLVDWTILKDKQIYILPDNDEPGLKAAEEIKKQLPHAIIVKPLTDGKGDDIEQYIDIITPEYILKASDITPPAKISAEEIPPQADTGKDYEGGGFSEPFKILGMCEGEGYYIDSHGNLRKYKTESLNKTKLMNIINIDYWRGLFPSGKDGVKWDDAISHLIDLTKVKDFDPKRLKGIGAWRDGNKICYNDGLKVYGEPSEKFVYVKDAREYIGLEHDEIEFKIIERLRNIMFDLSFETKTDAVRTMGWTALAPFCGALVHRPILFFTGESSTGKSEVQKLIVQKIAKLTRRDMKSSSTAGIRREIKQNSRCYFIDEAGRESEKMKLLFDEIMAFARSSYSDDSPDGVKANVNGEGVVHFKFSSMFGFASTNPSIENVQDDNRILRVHFVKPKHTSDEWQKIEKELEELLTEDNCHKIRAFIWTRLKIIIDLADKITTKARSRTNRDLRSSRADMLLAASYMVVWCNTTNPNDDQINDMLDKYYQYQPIEENRSESEEYVDQIMSEIIEVIHKDGKREKLTIVEAAERIRYENILNDDGQYESLDKPVTRQYSQVLGMYGIKVVHGNIHIENNNHMIRKITGLGTDYSKLLARHKNRIEYKLPVTYTGRGSKRGVMIKDLIPKRQSEIDEQKKLEETMYGKE